MYNPIYKLLTKSPEPSSNDPPFKKRVRGLYPPLPVHMRSLSSCQRRAGRSRALSRCCRQTRRFPGRMLQMFQSLEVYIDVHIHAYIHTCMYTCIARASDTYVTYVYCYDFIGFGQLQADLTFGERLIDDFAIGRCTALRDSGHGKSNFLRVCVCEL